MTVDEYSVSKDSSLLSTRFLHPGVVAAGVLLFLAVGACALIWLPGMLLDHWLVNQSVDASMIRLSLGSAAQVVLFSLGGVIALVGVSLSLSRHRLELEESQHGHLKEDRRVAELAQQRKVDAERELRARFSQAVTLLSDPDKATTRQAGVYALGALADDWSNHGRLDERQVCIDVLCGYLRSHWDTQSPEAGDERRIRAAAFNLIAAHHRPDAARPSWDGADFNIRDAIVDFNVDFQSVIIKGSYIDLSNGTFSGGTIRFNDSIFAGGSVQFHGATFSSGTVWFGGVTFSGSSLGFMDSTFSGGDVWFDKAVFSGGSVRFISAKFLGGTALFHEAKFSGSEFSFHDATFSGAYVGFDRATFSAGSVGFFSSLFSKNSISFDRAEFSGGKLWIDHPTISGSEFTFGGANFADGQVRFTHADFRSGNVSFDQSKFSGGTVEINGQVYEDHPVTIPWKSLSDAKP